MRDFQMFTTEYGVSSLILREIPYRKTAYIRVQSCAEEDREQHLHECAAFCRAAGAERILALGEPMPRSWEPACRILKMQGEAWVRPEMLESLFPVTEATVRRWREIYNDRMRCIDNARTLEFGDEADIVKSGGAYFVHRSGTLLGIGWMEDAKLLAIASVEPGAGERVMNSLLSLVEGAQVELEVADTNRRAIALYERMGFVSTSVVSQWYREVR